MEGARGSLALLLALVGAEAPSASPGQEALAWAQGLRAEGRVAEAVVGLVSAADRDPGDPFADHVLAEAARWLRDDLYDPVRSLALWERLVSRHPDSRHARRAQAAADELRRLLGPGDVEAVRELLRIRRDAAIPLTDRVSALRGLVRERPDWAAAAGVEAPAPMSEPTGDARPGRRLDLAIAGLVAALTLALLAAAGVGRRSGAGLWPPPWEVRFAVPVYAALGLAAALQPAAGRLLSALALVGGGTTAWLWLAPAAAAAMAPAPGRPGAAWRWLTPAAAALYVAGLCFLAIRWQHLDVELLETLRRGAER